MTDERRDDEILGRALSRAIETMDVNQTPFERSRIANAPARRSIFGWSQLGFAVVGIILAVALGSWLTRPAEGQRGVAASPTAPAPSSSPAGTQAPASATPAQDRIWVYFARDGLPPTGGFATGSFDDRQPEARILSRLTALRQAKTGVPAGATNAFAEPTRNQSGSGLFSISARVQGDLATVEFEISDGWAVRGSTQSLALLQQLVYTITEEPGIRRALITEKGKANAVIDQLVVDKPLSREDVSGYTSRGSLDPLQIGGVSAPAQLSTKYSVDSLAPGLARFVITLDYGASGGSLTDPQFSAGLIPATNESTGKAELEITVPNGSDTTTTATQVDRSPLRWIAAGKSNSFRAQVYRLGIDDQRPWRAMVLSNPTRIVIDIGGDPRTTSDRISVTVPKPGDRFAGDIIHVAGSARVFEANVTWRIKNSAGKEVGSGHFMATLGSSAVWGTFDTSFAIPGGLGGNATLELFEVSPKDGSDQGTVSIPITITTP